ncbi:MAG: hypothetical protein FD167_187 [bacterium]|nr:MAG: hypothetical protein FD167_187 [bacterium]
MSILVVDDSENMRTKVASKLKKENFIDIYTASGEKQALQLLLVAAQEHKTEYPRT